MFIDAVEASDEGSAIVRTVAEMARTLSLQTVAEGIETRQQHTILRTLSCDLGQGYHFARPLKAEAVREFFANSGRLAGADTCASADRRPGLRVATTSATLS